MIRITIVLLLILVIIILSHKRECKVLHIINTENGTVQIVNATCKEGLPHTTDSETIRMTANIWESDNKEMIMKHERVHLEQKRNPEKWYEYYRRVWDYECSKIPPQGIPQHYIRNLRPNPDTADSPWAIWRGRWVFFPVFDESRTLKSAPVIVWDLKEKRRVNIPDEWKQIFCKDGICPNQYEHPHEISAVLITAGVMSAL